MRVLLVFAVFCCGTPALTRGDLTAKYGRSNWRQSVPGETAATLEQFIPASGVAVNAKYDSKGIVKELRIGPVTMEGMVRTEVAEKILNQLIPKKSQPPESSSGMTGACHHVTQGSNDVLTIVREFSDCDPRGMNVTVTWK